MFGFLRNWRYRSRFRSFGKGSRFKGIIHLLGAGDFICGRNVRFARNITMKASRGGLIEIGDDCLITDGVYIAAEKSVAIGARTMLGPKVMIFDADHGIAPGIPPRDQPTVPKPVKIGAGCWLGAGVIVLRGVTIGDGAVIGAGAVVTRDIPPNTVAIGIPARVIKSRE